MDDKQLSQLLRDANAEQIPADIDLWPQLEPQIPPRRRVKNVRHQRQLWLIASLLMLAFTATMVLAVQQIIRFGEDAGLDAVEEAIVPLKDVERQAIERALRLCDDNIPRAAAMLGVSARGAPVVGDKLSDVAAARRAGCRPILVRTGSGGSIDPADPALEGVAVYRDLAEAAEAILVERIE